MSESKESKSKVSEVATVIASYWIVSISMVYLNKLLLSNESLSIPAPLFVTWYQCIVTVVVCIVLGNLGEGTRSRGQKSFLNDFPKVKYDFKSGFQVLPLSLIFVAMITFNNLCLKYVEVSFYNVARSLSLVFNVIFSYFLLGQETNRSTLSTLLIICLGFYLGIEGEVHFSLLGTLSGVLSSVFVSLNSIYTAKVKFIFTYILLVSHWQFKLNQSINFLDLAQSGRRQISFTIL